MKTQNTLCVVKDSVKGIVHLQKHLKDVSEGFKSLQDDDTCCSLSGINSDLIQLILQNWNQKNNRFKKKERKRKARKKRAMDFSLLSRRIDLIHCS